MYGDRNAKRTIALAGGSHAEMWISAMDILGKRYGFKVKTYLKMGCALTTERIPKKSGTDNPYPECYDWGQRVVAAIIADNPDAVMTTTTRPRATAPRRLDARRLQTDLRILHGRRYPGDRRAGHPVAARQARRGFHHPGVPVGGRRRDQLRHTSRLGPRRRPIRRSRSRKPIRSCSTVST